LLEELKKELRKNQDNKKAKILSRFFKTKKGEYAEGDIFLGITVPVLRSISKKYKDITFSEIQLLLQSPYHEERLLALFILTLKFQKKESNDKEKDKIIKLYLKNTKFINNWDLVDLSAYKILGEYLKDKDKKILYDFARSNNLWERRIAIVSTYAFLKNKNPFFTIEISKILLKDTHDLINKAVGWMLREMGKNCGNKTLTDFLNKYSKRMTRKTLRYALEKLPKDKKVFYMNQ